MSAPNPPKPQQTLLSSYLNVVKRTTRSAAKANAKANADTSTTAPTAQHSPPNSPKDTRAAKRMRLGPQNLPTSEPDVAPVRSSARLAARAQNLSVVTEQKRARRTPIKLALPHEPAMVASPIKLALPEDEPVVEKDVPVRSATPEAPATPAKKQGTPATNRVERALQILDSPSKPTSARGTATPPVSAGLMSPRAAAAAGVLSPTAASPSKPKASLKDRFARLAERAPRRNLITAFESALPDKPTVPRTPTSAAGTPTVPASPATTTTDLTSRPTSATSRPTSISTAPTPRPPRPIPTSPTILDPYRLPHLEDINPSSTPLPTGSATRRPRLVPAGQPHEIAPTQRVPLSAAMTHLDQVFNGLEFSVAYQRGRGELCTFQSVQRNVENASSRAFTLGHVAQIRGVFPEAYDLQAVKADWHGNKVETVAFDFNVAWARKRRVRDDEDDDDDDDGEDVSGEEREVVSKPEFLAIDIPQRRIEFRARLIALVERAHRAFLAARDLRDWEPTDALRPWHPEFDLNTVAIPVMALPTLRPLTPRKRAHLPTAAAVRAAKAKVVAMDLSDSDESGAESGRSSPTPSSPKRPGVQQRFSKLLERVRAKEEQVKRDVLLGMSPEEVREKTMLSRLPLMAETVQIQLAQLGKNVAPLATLAQKVVDSYPTPMSLQMATEHLHLLAKTVPAWCNVVEIGVKKFVRIVPAAQASVKPTIAQAQQALAAKFAGAETDEGGEAGSSTTTAAAAPVESAAVQAVGPAARGGGAPVPTRASTAATRGGGGAALLGVRAPSKGGLAARQALLQAARKK
ncbi:replication licensing factor Cdt1 [Allomyces arbusculus]|nr:replication licensing factor Cdt1 [Allomyces arbusculus]